MQDETDFRVASIIFWSTIFAQQRGFNAEQQAALLVYVSESCTAKPEWHKDNSYRYVWESEHDLLLSAVHEKVEKYTEQWLASPLGQDFASERRELAESKKGKLDMHVLLKPDGLTGTNDCPGIQWGVDQIRDIFQFLEMVAPVDVGPRGSEEVSLSIKLTQVLQGAKEWFQTDFDALVKNPQTTESWYAKFSGAATAMVVNYIGLHLDYQGKKHLYSDETCKDVLMRIPTPPWKGRLPFPPFPIADFDLSDWRADMELGLPASETAVDVMRKRAEHIHAGLLGTNNTEMSAAAQRGKATAKALDESLLSSAAETNLDPDELDAIRFIDPSSFAMPEVWEKVWTPFMELFAGANQYGRAQMLIDDLRYQSKRLMIIANALIDRSQKIDIEVARVQQEITQYHQRREQLHKILAEAEEKEAQLDKVKAEREQLVDDPLMAELFAQQDLTLRTNTRSVSQFNRASTPTAIAPAFNRRLGSASALT